MRLPAPVSVASRLREFFDEEDGNAYSTVSFLMATLTLALPVGAVLFYLYGSVCVAGRHANLLLGLF